MLSKISKIFLKILSYVKQKNTNQDKFVNKYFFFLINPICAEIFSHPIGAGGGSHMTPPLISGHSGHKETN